MKVVTFSVVAFCLTACILSTVTYSEEADLSDSLSTSPTPETTPLPVRIRIKFNSVLDKPIPRARVSLYQLSPPGEEKNNSCGCRPEAIEAEAVSPAVFEKELEPGLYRVEVTADGWIGGMEEGVELKEGESRELEFTLKTGAVISGEVSDSGGLPVEGAEVSYWNSGRRMVSWLYSQGISI